MPELQLHPDRLLAHAAAAAGLSEELRAALRSAPAVDVGVDGEQERLRVAVAAAVRALAELSAALSGAAARASAADAEVSGSFARLGHVLGQGRDRP
jgi:hypothetical protein